MNPKRPDTKDEIAAKRAKRAAKHARRTAQWTEGVIQRAEWITTAKVEHETAIRKAITGVLKPGKGTSKCVIFSVVYKSFGRPAADSRERKRLRVDIDTVLARLYLEGVIRCRFALEGPTPDGHPRVTSMIYLRPTNDIPVNRIAASVNGPVWGSSGL